MECFIRFRFSGNIFLKDIIRLLLRAIYLWILLFLQSGPWRRETHGECEVQMDF